MVLIDSNDWTMCMCVDRCCRPPRYRPRTISVGGTHDRTNEATYSPHRYLLSRDMAYKVKVRASRLHLWRVDPYPTSANSRLELHLMRKVTYEVVRHEGGWVYRPNGERSEPFQGSTGRASAARDRTMTRPLARSSTGLRRTIGITLIESADTAASPLTRGAAASLRRSMNQRPPRPGGLFVKYAADMVIACPSSGSSSILISTSAPLVRSASTMCNGMTPNPIPARRK